MAGSHSYRLSPSAERDLEAILIWSQEEFGESARLSYEALVNRALLDLLSDPQRPGSLARDELAQGVRTYHLQNSRDRVQKPHKRVRKPRHLLVYRPVGYGTFEIIRVLHDSMDPARHLPADYTSSDPTE